MEDNDPIFDDESVDFLESRNEYDYTVIVQKGSLPEFTAEVTEHLNHAWKIAGSLVVVHDKLIQPLRRKRLEFVSLPK